MYCYVGAVGGGGPRGKKWLSILGCFVACGCGVCCFRLVFACFVVVVVAVKVLGEGVRVDVSRLRSSGRHAWSRMLQLCRKCLCSLPAVRGVSCGEERYCSVLVMMSSNFLHVFSWVAMLLVRAVSSVEKNSA